MAGAVLLENGNVRDYGGKLTASVIITCIMAASGGLIFGYDIGISGGITAMDSFLAYFFPGVLRRRADVKQNEYCAYNSQALTAFTSSLYIAGLIASLAAGHATRALGRRSIMLIGGATFFSGAAVNAAAVNISMLILGRILLGVGVGFTNQATPVYLTEMAPPRWRGAFSTAFQFFIGIGVTAANLTNYYTSRIGGWGWRLSLGLAAAPAAVIVVGAFLISDTPSSLVQRGRVEGAKAALRRARGEEADVEAELREVVAAVEAARGATEGAFGRMARRRYRPELVMAVAIPVFQQLTGVVIIAFYSPVLFGTVGFGSDAALMAAVVLGAVNLGSTLVSTLLVDRLGRKVLFVQGGAQMFVCQVAVACILGAKIGTDGEVKLSRGYSLAVLVIMCLYSAGFGWSWGPLSWLIPSEIFPVEIRSAGQSISVAINLGFTFIQTQVFLAMLCHFKYGIFAFNAAWVALMTAFVMLFLPETRGIPLESMSSIWGSHWFWRRFVVNREKDEGDKVNA